MPALLIHGVPDSYRVWDDVRAHLGRGDVKAPALPGFQSPVPPGFDATKEAYVDWVIAQCELEDGPVDLVGHDWGCMLTARAASLRPDLVRTWAGGSGPLDAEYAWHPWAKVWQTPELGDRWMSAFDPPAFAAQLQSLGVAPAAARATADAMDDAKKASILKLYRSAVTVGAEWGPDLARATAPSLVFWGAGDPACPVVFADRLAAALRGSVLRLDCGHWTPLEKPTEIARALEAHWRAGRS